MREQAMRYCLIALNFALAAMFFMPRESDRVGWLPPATPEELRMAHLRHEENLLAAALPLGSHSAAMTGDAHHGDSADQAYTSCETPIRSGQADPSFDF